MPNGIPKRRRLQFTLGQILALTLGVAIGFLPLRIWELFEASSPAVSVHIRMLEVSSEVLDSLELASSQSTSDRVVWRNLDESFVKRLESLCSTNKVKVVADTTMITLSDREASMNSGGEFPIAVPAGDGSVGIQYQEFGTRESVIPTILRNGRIRLVVKHRVSSLDENLKIQINDMKPPVLDEHSMNSTVELNRKELIGICVQAKPGDSQSGNKCHLFLASVDVSDK